MTLPAENAPQAPCGAAILPPLGIQINLRASPRRSPGPSIPSTRMARLARLLDETGRTVQHLSLLLLAFCALGIMLAAIVHAL